MHHQQMRRMVARTPFACLLLVLAALGGCTATTTAQLTPTPQSPVCRANAAAVIFWTTQWRADQKDVPAREAAAMDGITRFFQTSACFATYTLHRAAQLPEPDAQAIAMAGTAANTLVTVSVRELGPMLKLGTTAGIEGGTEVVLDITARTPPEPVARRFSIHWRHGGPGVIKGVASLPQDLQAALTSALQPTPH